MSTHDELYIAQVDELRRRYHATFERVQRLEGLLKEATEFVPDPYPSNRYGLAARIQAALSEGPI